MTCETVTLETNCDIRNKLFSGKPILGFGAASFALIFAVLSSLAALFALFTA